MRGPVRRITGPPEMNVRTFYRAVGASGENSKMTIGYFRKAFIGMYGAEAAGFIFGRTTPVYHDNRPSWRNTGVFEGRPPPSA
jgi:hypothetical protein